MKKCVGCKQDKELTQFNKRKRSVDGLHYYCKSCAYNQYKIYCANNKDKISAANKKYKRKNKYYDEQLAKQNGCCAICSKHYTEFTKRFAIDHKHGTTIRRGLLCSNCNTAIGLLYEKQELFVAASNYLSRTSSGTA
jgi:Recombination endonuclease VII